MYPSLASVHVREPVDATELLDADLLTHLFRIGVVSARGMQMINDTGAIGLPVVSSQCSWWHGEGDVVAAGRGECVLKSLAILGVNQEKANRSGEEQVAFIKET